MPPGTEYSGLNSSTLNGFHPRAPRTRIMTACLTAASPRVGMVLSERTSSIIAVSWSCIVVLIDESPPSRDEIGASITHVPWMRMAEAETRAYGLPVSRNYPLQLLCSCQLQVVDVPDVVSDGSQQIGYFGWGEGERGGYF